MLTRRVIKIDQALVQRSRPNNATTCVVANALDTVFPKTAVKSDYAFVVDTTQCDVIRFPDGFISLSWSPIGHKKCPRTLTLSLDEEIKKLIRAFDSMMGFEDCYILVEYDEEAKTGSVSYLGNEVAPELLEQLTPKNTLVDEIMASSRA